MKKLTEQEQRLSDALFETSLQLAYIVRDFGPAPVEGMYALIGAACPREAYDACITALISSGIVVPNTDADGYVWLAYAKGPKGPVN